ncbi:hypothetical protein FDH61_gp60 [Arthrobacter phage Preamble]|uniref:Uncharacterized protein n=1 Tax=Arthrobacter phage Preamble TaxID=1772310 RepID=A0A0U4JN91_9CAUD|nr:hypothetical protein FDH61_gp60 [Arthrobacter phage Preamble]ALY09841.1 hypothetical protein PREAMBLE_60 [Arthrobacter phage Preamble]
MKRYAIAASRWAYAGWCGKQGIKQDHAVYVTTAETLASLQLHPDQFIWVPGWEANSFKDRIVAAYNAATAIRKIAA